mgnify:FL=1
MKHTFLYTIFIFVALLTGPVPCYAQGNVFKNSVSIKQQNKTYHFTRSFDSLYLDRDSFAIEFETKKYDEQQKKRYATRIAAVTDQALVSLLKPGQKLANIPFFSEGTGLAAEEFGYGNLFIDNEGHHYITYTDEQNRRADLVSVNGELLKLRWHIPLAYYQDKDIEFSKLPLVNFSLVIFNDTNLNKTVDEGEFLVLFVALR